METALLFEKEETIFQPSYTIEKGRQIEVFADACSICYMLHRDYGYTGRITETIVDIFRTHGLYQRARDHSASCC